MPMPMPIPVPRRPFRMALCLLASLAMTLPAALPAAAQSHDDPHGPELNFFKRSHGDAVSLLTAAGDTALVRSIVIRTGRGTLAVDTADGVATVDQNRVRVTGVPVLGRLFQPRYSLDDLQERKRVGTVYLGDDRLFVDFDRDDRFHPITQVVVLNQNNAYELQAPPRRSDDLRIPTGTPAGAAYLKEGETLIVLVEPSVIQHNIFEKLF